MKTQETSQESDKSRAGTCSDGAWSAIALGTRDPRRPACPQDTEWLMQRTGCSREHAIAHLEAEEHGRGEALVNIRADDVCGAVGPRAF